jgi:Rab3 GTPase-activating protein catalytic subunit
MFRVTLGVPDQRTCLLHQKLQMLNCCIERKQTRELAARTGSVEGEDSESGRFISICTSVQPLVGHLRKIMEYWHRNGMYS